MAEFRNCIPDELNEFVNQDNTAFENMCSEIASHKFPVDLIFYKQDQIQCIQLNSFLENSSIPKYLLKILPVQTFESFHAGSKTFITPLSRNKIIKLDSWSKIEETIRFLDSLQMDNKKTIIHQQSNLLNQTKVGEIKYPVQIIVRAYEYFSKSRTLYNRLRSDYQLPSISTLTKVTSKVSKITDSKFLKSVFEKLQQQQKACIILIDEVYMKSCLTYHGGCIYGKAVNNPEENATTVLAFMLISLYGGPKFLVKMLPVHKLDAEFQFEQTNTLISLI